MKYLWHHNNLILFLFTFICVVFLNFFIVFLVFEVTLAMVVVSVTTKEEEVVMVRGLLMEEASGAQILYLTLSVIVIHTIAAFLILLTIPVTTITAQVIKFVVSFVIGLEWMKGLVWP